MSRDHFGWLLALCPLCWGVALAAVMAQIVYTLALKYSLYSYIGAKLYTICVHGPLGLSCKLVECSAGSLAAFCEGESPNP